MENILTISTEEWSAKRFFIDINSIYQCNRCNEVGGVPSTWKYKELNICTKCANEMRENKRSYFFDITTLTIYDNDNNGK